MRSVIIILSIQLILLANNVCGQAGNNWYFGNNAGITFNTTPPTALTNSSMRVDEGCSSISDKSGNLLFYTDGMTVYNKLHAVMPNGTGLLGNTSTTTVLIASKPGSNTIYYIFHSDNFFNPGSGNRYSEVDMNLNAGLGDVTTNKNILMGTPPATERVAAVKHANGKDFWIITKAYGNNRFNSYLLSCNGVDPNSVISDIGVVHNDPPFNYTAQAQMKVSPDGKKLSVVINFLNIVELFDFDNTTGQISNPIDITVFPFDIAGVYGTEFSPNNQVLYVSYRNIPRIYQFDISSNNQAAINASAVIIPSPYSVQALQLGPDGKLYIANRTWSHISVINNPNNYAAGYGFNPGAISLSGRICQFGLPAYITNYYAPPPIWVSDFTSAFINCYVEFSGTSTLPGPLQWNWDFGDGRTGTGQVVQHSYRQSGNYNITLKVYSLTNCSNIYFDSMTVTHQVTINNVFSVDYSYTGVCINQPYQFTDNTVLTVGNITGYNWDFGDGNSSTLQSPAHTYTSAGIFNVKFVVSTSGVCRADSITKTVYVDTKPLASFSANSGCVNQAIQFTDQSTNTTGPIIQWNWDFGGTGSSNAVSPSHTFTIPANYPVRLTVTSEHGCADDSVVTLVIEDKPVAAFTQNIVCFNKRVDFADQSTISFGTITNWQWDFGDNGNSTLQNPYHFYTTEGDFPVSLTVTSRYGCISDPFNFIAIVRKINAYAGPDTLAVYNEPIQLQGFGGVNYQWVPPFLLNNANIANPVATLTDDQVFSMTAIDAQGCTGSDDVKITVVKSFDIYVPTGFTPNGDGKNDDLKPYPVGIRQLAFFRVYNRWGQLVFATSQVGKGWDGKINGWQQDSGIYIWMVKATDIKGKLIEKKGVSILIR